MDGGVFTSREPMCSSEMWWWLGNSCLGFTNKGGEFGEGDMLFAPEVEAG